MEYRITLEQANRQTVRYILWPVLLLAAAVFIARLPHWDFSFWMQAHAWGFGPWLLRYVMWLLIFVAALLVGVFVHEGLHGVAIVLLARGGWRSLAFGFDRKTLSPFAHSRVPLRACPRPTIITRRARNCPMHRILRPRIRPIAWPKRPGRNSSPKRVRRSRC